MIVVCSYCSGYVLVDKSMNNWSDMRVYVMSAVIEYTSMPRMVPFVFFKMCAFFTLFARSLDVTVYIECDSFFCFDNDDDV